MSYGVDAISNNNWVAASQYCNYIPGVSVISNLVELFFKYVWCPSDLPEDYHNHVYDKPVLECLFFIFVPVISNLVMWIAACAGKVPADYSTLVNERGELI